MKKFSEVSIGYNFYIVGCLSRSRWIKISDTMATCVDIAATLEDDGNGRYELNQNKKFLPNQIVELCQ